VGTVHQIYHIDRWVSRITYFKKISEFAGLKNTGKYGKIEKI
jgi:hypothetical protein